MNGRSLTAYRASWLIDLGLGETLATILDRSPLGILSGIGARAR